MFGAFGGALAASSLTFVSQAADEAGLARILGLRKRTAVVKNTRRITKRDLVHNGLMPKLSVDPQTYEVRADGALLACEPAKLLPLAQRYYLF
jgi:urease subunit alpha